jgi:hypothetical protein
MEMNYEEGGMSQGKKTLWIIGGVILVIMIIGLVYGATQRSLKNADEAASNDSVVITPKNGGSSNQVNTSPSGQSAGNTSDSANGIGAGANDAGTGIGGTAIIEQVELPVTINSLAVVNLDTLPQKVQAKVTYGLSGDCAVLDTPQIATSGKIISLVLTSRAPKNAPCTKNIVPGETIIDIPVAGLDPGKYTVKLAKYTKTFTLKADSQLNTSVEK